MELPDPPELTGETQHLSMDIDRELAARVVRHINEKGSLMLEVSRLWKEVEKDIDVKESALSDKVKEVKKKEELVAEREKKVELLEKSVNEKALKQTVETERMKKEMEMSSKRLESREKEVDETVKERWNELKKKEEGFELKEKNLEEWEKELDLRKEEILLVSKAVDGKSREFDVKQKSETERLKKGAELMAIAHKELEAREKEVELRNETVNEKWNEVKKKEENLQVWEKELDVKKNESEQVSIKHKKQEKLLNMFRGMMVEKREENDEISLKLAVENERMEKEAEVMETSRKELEAREEEVKLLNETVKERLNELKKKEEEFELKQETKAREFEIRNTFLEEWEQKLGERLVGEGSRKRTRCGLKRKAEEHNNDDDADCVIIREVSCESLSDDTSDTVVSLDEDDDMDSEPFTLHVPNINDFDNSMSSFNAGQVWAMYDPIDDMPRYYARIKKVSKHEESLGITWLESVENTEGPVACGKFKYGASETDKGYLMFSHEMRHVGRYKNVQIYPRKGETWSVFRDWTSDREQHKAPYKYDIVEVISEFDAHQGIAVAYLKRVEGFTSVYKRSEENGFIQKMISCDEMLSFSHRVPSYNLIENEEKGIPNASFELDPAAIPHACLND